MSFLVDKMFLFMCYLSAETFYDDSFTSDFRVHVESDGLVIWVFGGKFSTACELDLTYFPFDKQICNFTIENWAYPTKQVSQDFPTLNHSTITG